MGGIQIRPSRGVDTSRRRRSCRCWTKSTRSPRQTSLQRMVLEHRPALIHLLATVWAWPFLTRMWALLMWVSLLRLNQDSKSAQRSRRSRSMSYAWSSGSSRSTALSNYSWIVGQAHLRVKKISQTWIVYWVLDLKAKAATQMKNYSWMSRKRKSESEKRNANNWSGRSKLKESNDSRCRQRMRSVLALRLQSHLWQRASSERKLTFCNGIASRRASMQSLREHLSQSSRAYWTAHPALRAEIT